MSSKRKSFPLLRGIDTACYQDAALHQYVEGEGRADLTAKASAELEADNWPSLLMAMQDDAAFMKRLRGDKGCSPRRKGIFGVATTAWKIRPAEPGQSCRALRFQAGSPNCGRDDQAHVLPWQFRSLTPGNMAILFIVGYMVEEALGKRRYPGFLSTVRDRRLPL